MSFKRVFIILFLLIPLISLGAEGNPSYIHPLSSPIYEWMEEAYLLEGLGHPSSSKPWSGDEVEMMARRLEENNPGDTSRELLMRIREENSRYTDDGETIRFSLAISPEIYGHTNTDEYTKEEDWIHGFDYRAPFLYGTMDLGFRNTFHLFSNLTLGWGRTTYGDTWTYLKDIPGFNGIGATVAADDGKAAIVTSSLLYSKAFLFSLPELDKLNIETPTRYYISTGGEGWFLSFSKDKLMWNNSHISSFIFDSHLEYQEYLRFKAYGEKLSLEIVYEFLDTDTSHRVFSEGGEMIRIMAAHALSYRFSPSLLLTLSENIMYMGKSADIRYLNPSSFFHNLNNSTLLNAIAHISLSWAPARGVNLYGQFVLDQATAPTESDSQAEAWGLSGGVEGAFSYHDGLVSWFLEGAYTTPELYRRNKVDFIIFQKYSTNKNYMKFLFFDYMGFPYGGDTIGVKGGAQWKKAEYSVGVEAEWRLEGEMDYFHSHNSENDNSKIPDIKDKTPYGESSMRTTISVFGEYRLPTLWEKIDTTLRMVMDWTKSEKDKGDFQYSVGITLKV